MILSSSSSSANGSNDEYLAVDDIGAEIEAYFEGFEQSIKNDILYEVSFYPKFILLSTSIYFRFYFSNFSRSKSR